MHERAGHDISGAGSAGVSLSGSWQNGRRSPWARCVVAGCAGDKRARWDRANGPAAAGLIIKRLILPRRPLAPPGGSDSRASSAGGPEAHTPAGMRAVGSPRSGLGPAAPPGLPFFCVDLSEDLDLQVPLCNERLQPNILPLEALQPLSFVLPKAPILLASAIEGLSGHPMELHKAATGRPLTSCSRSSRTICSS
jgi:hypothetical protein